MKIKVPQATSKGYIECEENGCFDWTYPASKLRRGRVQGGGMYALPSCTDNRKSMFLKL